MELLLRQVAAAGNDTMTGVAPRIVRDVVRAQRELDGVMGEALDHVMVG